MERKKKSSIYFKFLSASSYIFQFEIRHTNSNEIYKIILAYFDFHNKKTTTYLLSPLLENLGNFSVIGKSKFEVVLSGTKFFTGYI